jgi:hypothetical protein
MDYLGLTKEPMMKKFILILTGLFVLLCSLNLSALPITRHDDPLVKELEARYAKFSVAARHGDLKTFRSLRTAEANNGIPPDATGDQLKQMAEMMAPDLTGFKFVQLETNTNIARAAYKQQTKEGMSILVLMFEKEGAEWKIGNNHSQDYIGQTPKEAAALKQALSSPEVQFPKK